MISVVDVAYFAGYVFLFLTVAGSADAAWRHRDPNRLDILALVVSVLAGPFIANPRPNSGTGSRPEVPAKPVTLPTTALESTFTTSM